jgi:hypothetical protein
MDPSSVRAPIGALVRRRDSLELDVSEPLLSRVRAGEGQSAQLQGHGDARSSQNPSPGQGTWRYLVGLCAVSVVICYADRSNISTAILPMAEQFGWDKVGLLECFQPASQDEAVMHSRTVGQRGCASPCFAVCRHTRV